jgi:hypothetical protein
LDTRVFAGVRLVLQIEKNFLDWLPPIPVLKNSTSNAGGLFPRDFNTSNSLYFANPQISSCWSDGSGLFTAGFLFQLGRNGLLWLRFWAASLFSRQIASAREPLFLATTLKTYCSASHYFLLTAYSILCNSGGIF